MIQNVQQKWSNMSKGQKVATVAGATVGAVAVGSAIAAGVMGKDSFTKTVDGVKKLDVLGGFNAGYTKLINNAQKLGQKVVNFARGLFDKKYPKA